MPNAIVETGTPAARAASMAWVALRPTVFEPSESSTMRAGGSYHEAASASELKEVYADLGSQIGYTTEPKDISTWFVRAGVLLALVGAVLSLLWTNRLV